MKTVIAALVITLSAALPAAAQTADVAGKWDVNFYTQQGTMPASLVIVKEGDKLTGTMSSQQGEVGVDVAVKEKQVSMNLVVQTGNGPINVALSGTVDGDAMKGEADFGGRGGASWDAKRAASQAAPPQNPPPAQDKPAPTMTGTWSFEVTHSAGVSTPTVTITQTGEKLSGKYQSSYGQFELAGTIKDTEFSFSVDVGTEQKVTLVYTGKLDGDTVKGNVTMGEMGEGTFTGKRK